MRKAIKIIGRKFLYIYEATSQNTARLPKADQWHHAKHSTELSANSYVIRINTYTLQTVLIKQPGPASQYRMQISPKAKRSWGNGLLFCTSLFNLPCVLRLRFQSDMEMQ